MKRTGTYMRKENGELKMTANVVFEKTNEKKNGKAVWKMVSENSEGKDVFAEMVKTSRFGETTTWFFNI